MGREQGTFKFAANLEIEKGAPLDSRMLVQNISDLTDSGATWNAKDGKKYLFNGLIVSVTEDNNLYMLIDAENYTDINSWKRVGSSTINLTYSELVELRDNSRLIPGQKYRITDYVTTTTQPNTQSAEHQFDIIVEALSEDILSENAKAIQNENDGYFDDANLETWELKYCLDNDISRFAWVNNGNGLTNIPIICSEFVDTAGNVTYGDENNTHNDYFIKYGYENDIEGNERLVIYKTNPDEYPNAVDYQDKFFFEGVGEIDGVEYNKWRKIDNSYGWDADGKLYVYTEIIVENNQIKNEYIVNEDLSKGAIYYMKDEWNNEAPYDFKNIKFYREEQDKYVFTFSWINENDEVEDLTLRQDLLSDGNDSYGTHNNIIKPYYQDGSHLCLALNNIVFISTYDYNGGLFYGCYFNTFGINCYNNTFGNYCNYNTFGYNCDNNTFGNYCKSNTFGDYCYNNTLGNDCCNNTFGYECIYNTLGDSCQSNTFGNECYDNTFGINCYNNTFGNYCNYNTFGEGCVSNTFGNSCCSNGFDNECYSNSFGNLCSDNTLGNDCCNNTFGNDCNYNTLGNNCNSNTFGDNCGDNTFGDTCNSNSFGYNCYNNTFGNSCHSNTFGNDCHNNGFYDDSSYSYSENLDVYIRDGEKLNYVQYVTLNEGCHSLLFHTSEVINENNKVQNITVTKGIKSIETDDDGVIVPLLLEIPVTNNEYELKIARNINGDIKMYCEANLIK